MEQSLAPAAAGKSTLIGDTGRRLLLIMNPYSGMKIGKQHLADILEKFCRAGYVPTTFMTTGRGNATDLAARYGAQADLIVCLGGDGTFNEVVSGMLKADVRTPIGYIPCGSTNDFAASIGLSRGLTAAADDILAGTPHTYDIGRFDQRYFSYVASFGAFTRASYATSQDAKNILGHLAYVLAGIGDLSSIRPYHVRFDCNGRTFEDDYVFGAISNSTSVGGVLTLDPNAVDMNDGMFELLLIKMPKSAVELGECVRALQQQKYDSPMLTFHSTDRLIVTADPGMDWTLDGEREPGHRAIWVENIHNAIRLMKRD